ncbi:MAG: hypothetical protein MI919_26335, partial [Holophagales bacterium]|nr:hypothetical protein [Holophagales bacterium]
MCRARLRSAAAGLCSACVPALMAALVAVLLFPGAVRADRATPQTEGSGIFLYPDIHEDFVVFVHAEDLWRVPAAGGTARRLTSHAGQELFPKISPDGEQIAFSAEYSGSRQVWVMPAEGGEPRQLTYYTSVGEMPPRGGYDYWILDWTPDGKILVRANRTPWGQRMGRYFLVDPQGGLETPLPIPHGGTASFSPDGRSLAYTPIDREFRTWKHSRGGRAQDLWIYDFDARKSRRITHYRGTDNFPMWVGDRLYFTSDRAFTLELFAYDLPSGAIRQVTASDDGNEWDVLWPSRGPSSIVFVEGGELRKLDLATEAVSEIPVRVAADRSQTVPRFEDVSDNIQSLSISPSGQRVVIDARGDLFSVPAEKGPTRNLTNSQGVRERDPAWSPDGEWLAYVSDATGENEIWLRRRLEG